MLLAFTEASKQQCVALRGESGALLIAFANPFDVHLQSKIELQLSQTASCQAYVWMLAHSQDIAAYLAHHETNMRALDNVVGQQGDAQHASIGIEDISLKSLVKIPVQW